MFRKGFEPKLKGYSSGYFISSIVLEFIHSFIQQIFINFILCAK